MVKVDIDKNQALAAQYRVQSVPTLILFKAGQPVWRTAGLQQGDTLKAVIEQNM